MLIGSASFCLILVYLPLYAARELHVPMQDGQIATIICCVVQFFVCPGGGRFQNGAGDVPCSAGGGALCADRLSAVRAAHR